MNLTLTTIEDPDLGRIRAVVDDSGTVWFTAAEVEG